MERTPGGALAEAKFRYEITNDSSRAQAVAHAEQLDVSRLRPLSVTVFHVSTDNLSLIGNINEEKKLLFA
jgi:hypothetical protein